MNFFKDVPWPSGYRISTSLRMQMVNGRWAHTCTVIMDRIDEAIADPYEKPDDIFIQGFGETAVEAVSGVTAQVRALYDVPQ